MEVKVRYFFPDGTESIIDASSDTLTIPMYFNYFMPIEPDVVVTIGSSTYSFYLMDLIEYLRIHHPAISINNRLVDILQQIVPDIPNIVKTTKPYLLSTLKRIPIHSVDVGYEQVSVRSKVISVNSGSSLLLKPIHDPIDSKNFTNHLFSIEGLWFPITYHANTKLWYVYAGYDIMHRIYNQLRYMDTKRSIDFITLDYTEKLSLLDANVIVYSNTNPYLGLGLEFRQPIGNDTLLTIGGCPILPNDYTKINDYTIAIDFMAIEFYKKLGLINMVHGITDIPTKESDYTNGVVLSQLFSLPGSYLYILNKPIVQYTPDTVLNNRWVEMDRYQIPIVDTDTSIVHDSIFFKSSVPIETVRLNGSYWHFKKSTNVALIQ